MKDKLEGAGLPTHGLVNLDVFRVLALPLYLYVEPWGRFLEKEPPQSRFSPQGKSPSWTPGPDTRVLGIWPLAFAKLPFALSKSLMGFTPWPK